MQVIIDIIKNMCYNMKVFQRDVKKTSQILLEKKIKDVEQKEI